MPRRHDHDHAAGHPDAPPVRAERPALGPARRRELDRRRTIIPPALVLAVLLPAVGGAWFVLGAANPLHPLRLGMGPWAAGAMIALGLLAAAVAAANMAAVARAAR